ncbi:hypothetical protein [Micromonospora globbae]|uniref:hypothetical protein n=1 Tax=Micromonospora globbae TaxID=1894969 RepID=UPI003412F9E9
MSDDAGKPRGMADTGQIPDVSNPPTCCGKSLWPAGGPLVLACQLCPNSPTYWRKSEGATA